MHKQFKHLTAALVASFGLVTAAQAGSSSAGSSTDGNGTSKDGWKISTSDTGSSNPGAKDAKRKASSVGGAAMYPNKDIIDNAANSPIHTTLVAAVKAADLVSTLKGAGPFTVFAPTDAAFKELPAGTVESLVKPENKPTLTKILTYHVVAGELDAADLKKQIKDGGGSATLKTVQGEDLTAKLKGSKIELVDAKGNAATVTQANVYQSNGVIHVIDKVLMP